MIWFNEKTFKAYVIDHFPLIQHPELAGRVATWLARGDGAAVYENHDLGSRHAGEARIVSFGSREAALETDEPPTRLPDFPGQINWRYQLVGRYRRDWLVTDSKGADGNDIKPGEQLPELGRFFTEQEAAEFIGTLPDAETGRYNIDGPAGWDGERTFDLPLKWTREDSRAANAEGWDVFDCDGSENGPLQLCKINDPETWREDRKVVISRTWDDDTDVWVFVCGDESPLHIKALAMIGQENPKELEAIRAWVASH